MNARKAVWAVILSIGFLQVVRPVLSQTTNSGNSPLEQIAWLVGGTWVAESKAADGSPVITEVNFIWANHKKLITYTITRKFGEKIVPTHEGMCGWHPGKKQLVIWEMDNEGNLTESLLLVNGDKLNYEELIYQADGKTLPVRAEVTREGENAFVFTASVARNGVWPEVFRAVYKRVE